MKSELYTKLSAILYRLNRQLLHFQPPEGRAKQLMESREMACQIQALLMKQFENMDEQTFRNWPKYSWMGKDGIDGWLLYLLSKGGMGSRTCVDFGAGTGADGNTFNLVMNQGFTGFMLDGNIKSMEFGRMVYRAMRLTEPTFIPVMLNRENIATVCRKYKLPESPELLSIDIDSIDYYLLEALPLNPSIIVLEFNNLWGPEESFTIPYHPNFKRELNEFLYGGASLKAFYDLLIPKGYKFIAVAASGFDAIFVKEDPRFSFVNSITLKEGFNNAPVWQNRYTESQHHPVRQKPWIAL